MASIKRTAAKTCISYRIRACVGTDEYGSGIYETMTWKAPQGMTESQAKKQVNREAQLFEDMLASGIIASKMTFAELCKEYLLNVKDTFKPTTYESHKFNLKKICEKIGHVDIKTNLKPVIRKYVAQLEEKGLAPATIRDHYKTISCVLTYAVQQDYIANNVCLGKAIKLPKAEKKAPKIMSIETANAYVEALKKEAPLKSAAW